MTATFRASKNRDLGREFWCVTFQHPLRRGDDGRPLRIRRGLGTREDSEADRLIEHMNRMLSDESYWALSARERAMREFDPRAVDIFYKEVEARAADPWKQREDVIPLPGVEDGYARVLLVGPTGAGKTTLLRQFIGTDPKKERFPSISTAKTTIFDMEIVCEEEGPFRAVVSFLPRDRVRSYVEECVTAAVSAAVSGQHEDVILRRLLEHSEQRFRLSYLLGTLSSGTSNAADGGADAAKDIETDLLEDNSVEEEEEGAQEISSEERVQFELRLRHFLSETMLLAREIGPSIANKLEVDPKNLDPDDRDVFLELVEDAMIDHPGAHSLIEEILSEIELRIGLLGVGDFQKERSGWPSTWSIESHDRRTFVKSVNRFSSNYAPNFGKLLAPIVQGMRVAGCFRPLWCESTDSTRFVFIDGEGLGHAPASASTVPTSITKRYDIADVILLVDSATQPIQAAAQAVLRSVAAGGHDAKLVIAFTHFDQVEGDNLPSVKARKEHVLGSLESALRAVRDVIGADAARRLRRRLEERVFFVSHIQDVLAGRNRLTKTSLRGIFDVFRKATIRAEAQEGTPVYDLANLVLAVERATGQFHDHWNAKLGLGFKPGVPPEHWTRIKALSRRFAYTWEDQYDTLRPVADLIAMVSERLAMFLTSPRDWDPVNCTEAAKEEAVGRLSREVYARLHSLLGDRLFHDHVSEWLAAFEYRGTGSTRLRSQEIRGIYETAAPIPAEVPGKASTELLDMFRDLFREAAHSSGAKTVS